MASRTTLPNGDGTLDADFEVIEVRTDRSEGPRRGETIAVHLWFIAGLEEALAEGDSVHLALSSTGLEREMVSYVIARDSDGDHRLVGRCMSEGESAAPGSARRAYNARMAEVIGSTDAEATLSLLWAT